MPDEFSRSELLLGSEALKKLKSSGVAVFGVGGVGSYAVEGLARAGIGSLILVDDDRICLTNINRQLHATSKTIGRFKADVMCERVMEINPEASVEVLKTFYTADAPESFFEGRQQVDYIVDAIDTVSSKIALVLQAKQRGIPIISCMGAGNKLDPTKFEVTDIYRTNVCPLAKVMRHELRQRGVESLKVVYSPEPVMTPAETDKTICKFHDLCPKGNVCHEGNVCPEGTERKCTDRRQVPGSVSWVPSVAGLIMAGEVVKDIVNMG